jgi:hypothetical protein
MTAVRNWNAVLSGCLMSAFQHGKGGNLTGINTHRPIFTGVILLLPTKATRNRIGKKIIEAK